MNYTRAFTSIAAVAVAGGIAVATLSSAQDSGRAFTTESAAAEQTGPSGQVTIWRAPGCGCCDAYAEYLRNEGFEVGVIDDRDFVQRSVAAGVPERGVGCHLAMIDGYYVSGLVPAEIIERLLEERPDITGITLPGMPANAPGMAREKTGKLRTYSFGTDGVEVYADE